VYNTEEPARDHRGLLLPDPPPLLRPPPLLPDEKWDMDEEEAEDDP
jgi:hypothetical protein